MATYEHTRLIYHAASTGTNFIDITRGLALMNGKNCSQFTSDDKPILVHASVRLSDPTNTLQGAKSSWIVRNACVKAAAAWRRTLRSAGIYRKKQLNTYARNPRFALNYRHSIDWEQLGAGGNCDLIPQGVHKEYNSGQYNSDGEEMVVVAYNGEPTGSTPWGSSSTPAGFYRTHAFTQTTFAVPQSGSTDVTDKKANLLGDVDNTYSNVVAEYIDSRINDAEVEDTDLDASPSNDNDFVMMLAPGEEVADDVLDNVDDEGKWRPYDLASSCDEVELLASGTTVAGQDAMIEVPLGLIAWQATATDVLMIDVVAISEM